MRLCVHVEWHGERGGRCTKETRTQSKIAMISLSLYLSQELKGTWRTVMRGQSKNRKKKKTAEENNRKIYILKILWPWWELGVHKQTNTNEARSVSRNHYTQLSKDHWVPVVCLHTARSSLRLCVAFFPTLSTWTHYSSLCDDYYLILRYLFNYDNYLLTSN